MSGLAGAVVVQVKAELIPFQRGLEKAKGEAQAFDRTATGAFSRTTREVRSMNSAVARSQQEFRNVTASAMSTQSALASFARGAVGAIAAGFSAQAAKELIDSATRITNALKVAGLSGEELTAVYEHLYASAQKNGAPLEALATLYGRAAQQQKELGVSTEQLLKFTDDVSLALRVAGTDATTASGALLQLGQLLGSGTAHAEEFNSVLEGVPTIAQAAAAGIKEANGSVAKLKQLVIDGKLSSRAFFDGFAAGADTLAERARNSETTISAGFVRLQNVLVDVARRFDDSTHASRILADMIDHTLIPAIQDLGGFFTSVANGPIGQFYDWLGKTIDRVVQLSADFGALTGLDKIGGNPYIGPGRIQDRIDSAFAGTAAAKGDRKPAEITVDKGTPVKPITLHDYPVSASSKSGGRRRIPRTADDRFGEDIQEIQNRTAALKEEQVALGLSYEEQTKRSTALQLEQTALRDVQEAARRKGDADWKNVQLSKEQRQQIDDVSAAYARQADALREAQEAQTFQRDVLKGMFSDIRSALEDGKITTEEWGNVFLNVLDTVVDRRPDEFLQSILEGAS